MSTPTPAEPVRSHTALPWEFDGTNEIFSPAVHASVAMVLECANAQANAELIVRAVNAHDDLVAALRALVDAKALKGVREQVAGWNGEGREGGPFIRHPNGLGATLPKTNCGAVYALDDAMQAARAVLAKIDADGAEEQGSKVA